MQGYYRCDERLTWEEIKSKYPNKWVGIENAERSTPTSPKIKSGIVCYIGDTRSEVFGMKRDGQNISIEYTTPENLPQIDCYTLEFM